MAPRTPSIASRASARADALESLCALSAERERRRRRELDDARATRPRDDDDDASDAPSARPSSPPPLRLPARTPPRVHTYTIDDVRDAALEHRVDAERRALAAIRAAEALSKSNFVPERSWVARVGPVVRRCVASWRARARRANPTAAAAMEASRRASTIARPLGEDDASESRCVMVCHDLASIARALRDPSTIRCAHVGEDANDDGGWYSKDVTGRYEFPAVVRIARLSTPGAPMLAKHVTCARCRDVARDRRSATKTRCVACRTLVPSAVLVENANRRNREMRTDATTGPTCLFCETLRRRGRRRGDDGDGGERTKRINTIAAHPRAAGTFRAAHPFTRADDAPPVEVLRALQRASAGAESTASVWDPISRQCRSVETERRWILPEDGGDVAKAVERARGGFGGSARGEEAFAREFLRLPGEPPSARRRAARAS